jgi:hypothetical protein
MVLTEANSQLVYQSALAAPSTVRRSCQQRHLCYSPQYCLVSCHPRHLWTEWAKGNDNLVYPSLWEFKIFFLHAVKSYDMGPPALLPTRRKVRCGCLLPLRIHHVGRARTRKLWVSGTHTNHYTTEATG